MTACVGTAQEHDWPSHMYWRRDIQREGGGGGGRGEEGRGERERGRKGKEGERKVGEERWREIGNENGA